MIGVAIASDIQVKWGWSSNSVSQIAASWGIAPVIAAGFAATIMMSIKLLVHRQQDPMKAALTVITFYYGLTAGILALFIVISGGHGIPELEDMGAGVACGIILGVFFGVWIFSAIFFLPYYYRKLVKEDRRLRIWHIPMGPLLWRDGYKLYYPGDPNHEVVPNYYSSEYTGNEKHLNQDDNDSDKHGLEDKKNESDVVSPNGKEADNNAAVTRPNADGPMQLDEATQRGRQKDLKAVDHLPWAHPRRIWATIRLVFTYGITRDVIGHQSKGLEDVHARAPQFDNKVEHLWTTAQICSAIIMSIAHGANDVSNAIGPFTTEYETWSTGVTSATTDTPIWIKAVGGLGLGLGFWTFGYRK